MGVSQSRNLDPQLLEDYQDCTFFTKKEIIHVHQRFNRLLDACKEHRRIEDDRIPLQDMLQLPELRVLLQKREGDNGV